MLISYKHKFLFVHIAKTGGTSVRAALRRYRWGGAYTPPALLGSAIDQLTGHHLPFKFPRHAKAIAAKEMLPDALYRELFKFTVVRNPFAMQVSAFHHLKREHADVMHGLDDFGAYIAHKFDPDREPEWALDITMPRLSEYVVDLDGVLIVDFIARQENLQADFDTICGHIGVPKRPLPRLRRTRADRPYQEYYDARSRVAVEEYYRRDLEMFGYSF